MKTDLWKVEEIHHWKLSEEEEGRKNTLPGFCWLGGQLSHKPWYFTNVWFSEQMHSLSLHMEMRSVSTIGHKHFFAGTSFQLVHTEGMWPFVWEPLISLFICPYLLSYKQPWRQMLFLVKNTGGATTCQFSWLLQKGKVIWKAQRLAVA